MRHFRPSAILSAYVNSFVISESTDELIYRVLPAPSIVMGFQYQGSLSKMHGDSFSPLSACGVTGLTDRVDDFRSSKGIGTVLVYFSGMGAAHFLPVPAHELFGESHSLTALFNTSRIGDVHERLCEASDDVQRIRVIESFLLSHIRDCPVDALVGHAVQIIASTEGNIRMSGLSDRLNISSSQMEKRFRRVVGCTPKKYASIIRFNCILKHKPNSKTLIELAYRVGYFDQAHFNKDFKAFTGLTPEKFFSQTSF